MEDIKVYDDNLLIRAFHNGDYLLTVNVQTEKSLDSFNVYCNPLDWKKYFNMALNFNGYSEKTDHTLDTYGISDSRLQMELRARRVPPNYRLKIDTWDMFDDFYSSDNKEKQ